MQQSDIGEKVVLISVISLTSGSLELECEAQAAAPWFI
jgi:hypothetical protein